MEKEYILDCSQMMGCNALGRLKSTARMNMLDSANIFPQAPR